MRGWTYGSERGGHPRPGGAGSGQAARRAGGRRVRSAGRRCHWASRWRAACPGGVRGHRHGRARGARGARAAHGLYAGEPAADGRRHARGGAGAPGGDRPAGGRGDRHGPGRGQGAEEPDRPHGHPGGGGPCPGELHGRPRADAGGAGPLRGGRLRRAEHQPDRDDLQQRHRDGGGGQCSGVQRPPRGQEGQRPHGGAPGRGDCAGGGTGERAVHGGRTHHRNARRSCSSTRW